MTDSSVRKIKPIDKDGVAFGLKRKGNIPVVSIDSGEIVALDNKELLQQILIVLKKIEYHLCLSTDEELKDEDV